MQAFLSRLSSVANATPKRAFLSIVALVLVLDLILVRDFIWLAENVAGKRFLVNFGLSSLALILLLIACLPFAGKISRNVLIALLVIPQFIQLSFFAVYRNFVSVFDLRFVAADPWLTLLLWLDNAAVFKPLLLLLIELPLLWILVQLPLRTRWWARGLSGVFGSLLFLLLTFNWYGVTKFQFSSLAYIGTFPGLIEQQVFSQKLADKPELTPRTAAADAPNIVYVVGESLARSQMGIYGYERNTTPGLQALVDSGQAMAYDNAVSIGTRTLSSVPYMLTGLQGIDPHGLVYSVPTIFNYAKAAGYQTALITAQDFRWRNVDQIFVDQDLDVFRDGSDFSANISVSNGADDLKVLRDGVVPYIRQAREDGRPYLLVTQMNGSHYPFDEHSPAEFKRFLPEDDPNGINAYDNTVVYSDAYLTELVAEVRRDDPSAWVFYSTDHGQFISSRGTTFNGGYNAGTIHNVMLVFPPQNELDKLLVNQDRPVTQADIFATVLSLLQIDPVLPVDGVDLQQPVDEERLRVVSAYMKTLHNEPNAILLFADLDGVLVNFERRSATYQKSGEVVKYDDLPAQYREIFERRLNPQKASN